MPRLKPLIGICGAAGSGKDTLATGIAQIDVYFVYHFADPIKNAINEMFGWGPANWENRDWKERTLDWIDASPRSLAQTLGTEWGREVVDQEIWLKLAQRKFERVSSVAEMKGGRIVGMGMIIPDVRFENEAQWINDAGGLLFEVVRPGQEEISENSHASEAGFAPALIHETIVNDGPPSQMITEARRILWEYSEQSESSLAV